MFAFRVWLTGCAAVLPLVAATAQQTPSQQAQAPKVRESVEVGGSRPAMQNLADRQSYTISHDLQSAAGSISDVLKNLPSIEIDALGGISLRGDPNVTILIDGKISPLLAGNRADALEQIPADSIDRVEVITNPSAEFKAEGSGGIINIITRKDAGPGYTAALRFNVGSEGRLNASATGGAKLGDFTLGGSFNERRDLRRSAGTSTRTSGNNQIASQSTTGRMRIAGRTARLGVGVELDDRNELELSAAYAAFSGHNQSSERNISLGSDSTRTNDGHLKHVSAQLSLEYAHDFATKGEKFKFEISRGTHWSRQIMDYITAETVTGAPDEWQWQNHKERETELEIDSSYVLPLASGATFKAGYSLEDEGNFFNTQALYRDSGMADWATDTDFTSSFTLGRAVHAGFATYEDKFGAFGLLGGLRLEQEFLSTNQVTMGEKHKSSSLRFYPSLHLTYALTDTKQLKLSYSRRVNRPDEEDLNPIREMRNAFNVQSGNPNLKPEEIDSIEAAYQYTGEDIDALITSYFRKTSKGITDVSYYISPTVLLTTKENLASGIAAGVEATANGKLFKDLGYRLTANVSYSEIDPGRTSLYGKRSGITWTGKAGLDYQITPDDLLQFSANYSAKQLLPQGYRKPTLTANAGFRHNFNSSLSGVFTVNNLLDSNEHNSILDSGGVREVSNRSHPGRVFYLGLVYRLGASQGNENGAENGGANGEDSAGME